MSGIEIIGLVASVVQIADLGAQLSVKLFVFSRKIKSADKSIQTVSQDIAATGAVLQQLSNELSKDKSAEIVTKEALKTTQDLIASCQNVFTDIDAALDGRISNNSLVTGWRQRFKFSLVESQVELLRSNLERLKSSLLLMLNVLSFAIQARTHRNIAALKDNRTLIETLIEDKNASEEKYNQAKKAIEWEASSVQQKTGGRPPDVKETSIGGPNLPSITASSAVINTIRAPLQESTQTNKHARSSSTKRSKIPSPEIHQDGAVVENLLAQLKSPDLQIGYSFRDKLHVGISGVHWNHWAPMRRLYGDETLLDLLSKHPEVVRFWLSRLETETLDKIKSCDDKGHVQSTAPRLRRPDNVKDNLNASSSGERADTENNLELAKELIAQEYEIDTEDESDIGRSALYFAIDVRKTPNRRRIVELLVSKDARKASLKENFSEKASFYPALREGPPARERRGSTPSITRPHAKSTLGARDVKSAFDTASPANVENEMEAKEKLAMERQAKVIAQSQQVPKPFVDKQGMIDWGEDDREYPEEELPSSTETSTVSDLDTTPTQSTPSSSSKKPALKLAIPSSVKRPPWPQVVFASNSPTEGLTAEYSLLSFANGASQSNARGDAKLLPLQISSVTGSERATDGAEDLSLGKADASTSRPSYMRRSSSRVLSTPRSPQTSEPPKALIWVDKDFDRLGGSYKVLDPQEERKSNPSKSSLDDYITRWTLLSVTEYQETAA